MARCLNPRAGHDNPASATCCSRCDYLVEGARIGIYEVVSFLGAGSYGHVYQVREPAPLGRVLALKVLGYEQFNARRWATFSTQRGASLACTSPTSCTSITLVR